jgi:fumarylpyruvate hydrolase
MPIHAKDPRERAAGSLRSMRNCCNKSDFSTLRVPYATDATPKSAIDSQVFGISPSTDAHAPQVMVVTSPDLAVLGRMRSPALLSCIPHFNELPSMSYVITAAAPASLAIVGTDARFPLHRIYCIGRNYADHAKEMGAAVERSQPMFFMKPADAVVTDGADVPYPSATQELHHEVEMVVALAHGGHDIPVERALDCVFGYGVGLDLTRRDLQAAAKAKGHPWDMAKAFDHSAPVSALRRVAAIGHPAHARLTLDVNGERRQQADISDMIFGVAEIIHELSKLWTLVPGDLIFAGTPAGVAALLRGDRFRAELAGMAACEGRIV